MKSTKLLLSLAFIVLLPFPLLNSQEKKTEKKIKIVVDDKSGKKVLIDTILYNDNPVDSIKLKDGEVIYFDMDSGDKGDFIITRDRLERSGKPGEKHKGMIITVTSPDSLDNQNKTINKTEKVYVFSNSGDEGDKVERRYKVISGLERGGKHSGERYVYINENGLEELSGGDKFEFFTDEDLSGGDFDNTRYVVTKNGIRVTIEGKDDAKIQELVKEVEKKLDINKEETETKPAVKQTETKTIKKK